MTVSVVAFAVAQLDLAQEVERADKTTRWKIVYVVLRGPRRLKFRGKRGAELHSRNVRLSIDSF